MFSLFPELLFLAPAGALFIRVALGAIFAIGAFRRLRSGHTFLQVFGVIDIFVALGLILGLYTQLAALVATLCALAWLIKSEWSPYPKSTAALVMVCALSLLVTGPGPFAFDLPL